MTTAELDDGERAALTELLRRTIAADPFPLSPATGHSGEAGAVTCLAAALPRTEADRRAQLYAA